jgi:hypothetical protein
MDVDMTVDRGEDTRDEKAEHADLVAEAREQAREAESVWSELYDAHAKDTEFRAGRTQWPESVRQDRGTDRVELTINQLPKFERQVLGDGKQNRLQIKVRPIEANAVTVALKNVAGTQDYTYAAVMEGIIRNIEATSRAERAYDKALEHCVRGGFGWLRVVKRYARPDGFEQELCIQAVRNPCSVMVDPVGMFDNEPDFSAASYAFIYVDLPRRAAEKRWKNVTDIDSLPEASRPFWAPGDSVRVAEYFRVDVENAIYVQLTDGRVMTLGDYRQVQTELEAAGVGIHRDRRGHERNVRWALIDGGGVLDGPYPWDGGYIPLAPVLGPELIVDGRVVYESLFRHSHDAQRSYNYWRSAATEAVALAPKAPWLADAQSIAGFESDYTAASEGPRTLLKYRAREGVPPPQRVSMAGNPAAEIAQALHANDDIKNTIGMYDASLGARSNESSGRAILARQREGDVGTFEWHDALAKAVEHVGRILVDMVPAVYDTDRVVRVKTAKDAEDFVRINYQTQGEDGAPVKADLGAQRYDVAVTTGPSMTTQRMEAAQSLMDLMGTLAQAAPQAVVGVMDKVVQNMDWPGADEIAKRLRKMVPPQLLEASERAELAQQSDGEAGSDPQAEAAQAQAAAAEQAQRIELEARMKEATAKLMEAEAKLAEAQAVAPEQVREMIAEALAEVLAAARAGNASIPA